MTTIVEARSETDSGVDGGRSDITARIAYRGHAGSVEYDDEDAVFHGRLVLVRDLVTYEGADPGSIERAFREAVDDYLALCAEEGRKPAVRLGAASTFGRAAASRENRIVFRATRAAQNGRAASRERLFQYESISG